MKNLSAAGPAVWQCSSTTHTTDRKTATVTMGQAIIAASILLSFFKRKSYSQKLRTLSATEKERIPEERGGGKGQFITSKGTSKRKPDTNQTYLNQKDHTSCGPTGGNQTTTRTQGQGGGHPRPGPTTSSHHN